MEHPYRIRWKRNRWVRNDVMRVPRVRIELTTRCSSGICSTTELPRHATSLFSIIRVGAPGLEPGTTKV